MPLPTVRPQAWSTDDLPVEDRFAHWRELRARNIFGVSVEIERGRQRAFRGRFSVLPLGGAALVEMHASPYRVTRGEADIGRAPSDSLCIYQQLEGAGWFKAGGAEFEVPAGAIATSHSDLPYVTQPTTEAGFHLRLLKVPFARCKAMVEQDRPLWARPVPPAPGFAALFAAYFEAFVAQAPYLDGVGAEAAVQTLAQLAIVARGMADARNDGSRAAIRAGLLQSARRAVERNIHRADLSPAAVAASIGVSVRQLHLLFEPTGTSFSRYVTARRLEHARLLLARSPLRSVADIAFSCGFDSLATFYRGFRQAYGHAPGELRGLTGPPDRERSFN